MKKIFSLMAVFGILVAFGAFVEPPEACAGCHCPSFTSYTTAEWGMGATCTEAENNAIALADSKITCDVVCYWQPEIVTPCNYSDGMWKADARIAYKCEACIEPEYPEY